MEWLGEGGNFVEFGGSKPGTTTGDATEFGSAGGIQTDGYAGRLGGGGTDSVEVPACTDDSCMLFGGTISGGVDFFL